MDYEENDRCGLVLIFQPNLLGNNGRPATAMSELNKSKGKQVEPFQAFMAGMEAQHCCLLFTEHVYVASCTMSQIQQHQAPLELPEADSVGRMLTHSMSSRHL